MKDMMIEVDLTKNVLQLHGAPASVGVPQETVARAIRAIQVGTVASACDDGGLWQRPLLGARTGQVGARTVSN